MINAVWKNPVLKMAQITGGLPICSNEDGFNSVKDWYNHTVYSVKNDNLIINDDYLEAM